uniref:Transglutaminase C-terminal domain-containing protein n=1 Tax=Timema poppense TaxID=170557 RepID=A0A7R9HFU4_TIMPO|nr:unnamed protein product [Timema poppensis]
MIGCNEVHWIELSQEGIGCNEVDWTELSQDNDKCVQDTPRVGQESQVTFSFLNPLPVLLTECQFNIEGHGLQRPKNVNYSDVKPGEMVSFTESLRPKKHGPRKIVATFNSKQLHGVTGSTTIDVEK